MKKLLLILLLLQGTQLMAQYLGGSGYGEDDDVTSAKLLDGTTATATGLLFISSPANTIFNSNTFSATVWIVGSNNLRFNSSASISLSIGTNPGSGTLSGTTTLAASSGIAEFTGLSINNPGVGYTLSASATGASNAISNTFNVAAPTLVFSVQPSASITQNQAFFTRVSITDGAGNVLTLANPSVSMSISTNPNSGTLSGTTSVIASAGVASFTNLSINNEGMGYVLQATCMGATTNSNPFPILNQTVYAGGIGDGEAVNTNLNPIVVGGQKLWRGGISTDWATAANWYPSGVPASTDDISIETNSFNNIPVLDANRTVASIDFGNASKGIQPGAFSFTVSRGIFNASATQYVQTASTGTLKRNILNAETFTFPVGNSAYNPVTITNNTGTPDDFSVRVADEVLLGGTSGNALTTPRVNRTWHIGKTTPTANAGGGVNMAFQWANTQETGTMAAYSLNHHNGSGWVFARGYGSGASELVSGTDPKTLSFTHYKGTFSPFAIIGSSVNPLPIVLKEFTAQCAEERVTVTWTTASEHNTNYFRVDKSRNGTQWDVLGTIGAAGNSTNKIDYALTDAFPNVGITYYRLTQYDLDGVYETFDPQAVMCKNQQSGTVLSSYPNPSTGDFNVDLQTDELEGEGLLMVTDAKGTVVYAQDINILNGMNNYIIQRFEALPGMYYISVKAGASTVTTKHSLR